MMTDPGSMIVLVRMLKGAPLSCLLALALADGPVRVGWLCKTTGYSPHPVTEALKILVEAGLAQPGKRRSNWEITPQASRLLNEVPLVGLEPPACGNRVIRDSGPVSFSTTTAVKPLTNLDLIAVVEAVKTALLELGIADSAANQVLEMGGQEISTPSKRGRKRSKTGVQKETANLSQQPPRADDDPRPVPEKIVKALHQAGIFEPMASELARMPHVSVPYIQAHARKARREKVGTGLLIHRIRCGDPLPEDPESQNRYISGEYADFINH